MDESPNLPEGLVIPDHQLVRRIGKGGYGEIWLARNVMGTFRAVKVVFRSNFEDIKPYSREFKGIEKFEPLSRSHPGLVNILQIGLNNDAGYFYYVMELADDEVEGRYVDPDTYSARTLGKELASRGRLPARESLQIGIGLASALAHMHEVGLVHRDIKPSNIIFVNGQPKLADIGLVVPLADARTFVGTEGYIPPEGPGTIQADIYSLGKVLYEMSTGQGRDSFPELPDELATFADRETVVELNEVVVKACANTPEARYRSSVALRADLEMLLEGRSVRRLRFVERQLARATRLAAAAVVLAVAAGVFAYAINRIRNREKQLLANQYVAGGGIRLDETRLHAALPMFAEALRLQSGDAAAAQAHRLRVGSALDQSPRLLQFWEQEHNVTDLHFSSDGARMLVSGGKITRILDVLTGATNHEFVVDNNIETAAFSPDDRHIAIANDRVLSLFDAISGTNIFERKQHDHLYSAEFSPDGQKLVLGCGKGCAHLIDANTGDDVEALTDHSKQVSYASFSPDGSMIVTASYDGTARIWNAKTLDLIASLPHTKQWVYDAAFSPDNQRVITASSDHTMLLWAIGPHPQLLARMEHNGTVRRARFSPDGHWIVSTGWDHTVRFWNGHNGQVANSVINLQMPAMHAVFSPEGRYIAVSGKSGDVRLWDAQPAAPWSPGTGVVSANGEHYVTFASNSFRVWNARDDSPVTSSVNVSRPIVSVLCTADGRTVLALCGGSREAGGLAEVYGSGSLMPRSFVVPRAIKEAALSSDASKLLVNSGVVGVWSIATGELLFEQRKYEGSLAGAAFSPDSRLVAFGSKGNLYVLDARTGDEKFPHVSMGMDIVGISFSHDSSKLIVAGAKRGFNPGLAFICDARTGKTLTQSARHTDGVVAACFANDAKIAASGGQDSFVAVWDAGTGSALYERLPLSWQITSVAFSSDDRWLMATSWYEMRLWETRNGYALTRVFSAPGVFDDGGFCAGNTRAWVRSSRGLFFWDLPRSELNPDEIMALADHLGVTVPTGLRWNPSAFPISRLREQCTANAVRTRTTLESWHRQQARFFENEGDLFAAQFHRTQLQKRGSGSNTNSVLKSPRL